MLPPVASSTNKMKGGSASPLMVQDAASGTSVALDRLVGIKEEVSRGALRTPLPPRLQLPPSLAPVSLKRRPPLLPPRSLLRDVGNTREEETATVQEVATGKRAFAKKPQPLVEVPSSALDRVVTAAETAIAVAAAFARATTVARKGIPTEGRSIPNDMLQLD